MRMLSVLLIGASVVGAQPATAQDAARIAKVYSVIEVTATIAPDPVDKFPTVIVNATGMVNSGGWGPAELSPYVYITAPADGIQDFDLLAAPPASDAIVTFGFVPKSASVAGFLAPWVKGFRVHASTNEMVYMLDTIPEVPADAQMMVDGASTAAEGLPLPWPFPWFTPQVNAPTQ